MLGNKKKLKGLEDEVRLLRAQTAVNLYEKRIIYSRKDFGFIFNYLRLTGLGVEVGVRKGNYSDYLLNSWNGSVLYSVDPWLHYDDGKYVDGSNVAQKKQERIYHEAVRKLARYKSRSVIMRTTSTEAAAEFTDSSLDFVYLDAQHHYEAVKVDIETWLPKIRPGGVISGDDYADVETSENVFGVRRAVDEFVAAGSHDLILTIDGLYPSWFVVCK